MARLLAMPSRIHPCTESSCTVARCARLALLRIIDAQPQAAGAGARRCTRSTAPTRTMRLRAMLARSRRALHAHARACMCAALRACAQRRAVLRCFFAQSLYVACGFLKRRYDALLVLYPLLHLCCRRARRQGAHALCDQHFPYRTHTATQSATIVRSSFNAAFNGAISALILPAACRARRHRMRTKGRVSQLRTWMCCRCCWTR